MRVECKILMLWGGPEQALHAVASTTLILVMVVVVIKCLSFVM